MPVRLVFRSGWQAASAILSLMPLKQQWEQHLPCPFSQQAASLRLVHKKAAPRPSSQWTEAEAACKSNAKPDASGPIPNKNPVTRGTVLEHSPPGHRASKKVR